MNPRRKWTFLSRIPRPRVRESRSIIIGKVPSSIHESRYPRENKSRKDHISSPCDAVFRISDLIFLSIPFIKMEKSSSSARRRIRNFFGHYAHDLDRISSGNSAFLMKRKMHSSRQHVHFSFRQKKTSDSFPSRRWHSGHPSSPMENEVRRRVSSMV